VRASGGKRWQAQISYGFKQHHLGSFDTKQEAALAYDREARQCGEDKQLNYKSIKAAEEAAAQSRQAPAAVRVCVCKHTPAGGIAGNNKQYAKKKGKKKGALPQKKT
jgi:hypothetical protein